VAMGVDESRSHGAAAGIDDLSAGGSLQALANFFDEAILNQDAVGLQDWRAHIAGKRETNVFY